jgi:hypothetical protein
MTKGLQEGVASLDLAETAATLPGSDPDAQPPGAVLIDLPEADAAVVGAPPSIYDRVTYSRPSAGLPPLLEREEPKRGRQVGGVVAAAVVAAAVLGLIFYPTANDKYIRDLKNAGLLVQFPSHDAAIKAGKDFCGGLDGGAASTGTPADLIAVQHYCPAYEPGFTVTPAGQPVVHEHRTASTPAHQAKKA